MKQRLITGILMALVGIPILYFGGKALELLMLFITIVGSYEIVKMFRGQWPSYSLYLIPCISLLIGLCSLYFPSYMVTALISLFFLLVTLCVWDERYQITEIAVVFMFHMILIFALMGYQLIIQNDITHFFVLYIVLATCCTDIGAYFTGYYFGKHKLNERISPKKTIEGSIGGIVLGCLVSVIFAMYFIPEVHFSTIMILSFGMSIIGQIGDLLFSAIKRHYHIKDYGTIFPGHGGVLDRMDSILINFVFAYAILLVVM
ncbi:MAG: phosphatidate cytidylyltransferase [Erysipelotrichaceae bacterium]|nr:phosphatidate cytidylyltransferase [Erysipelotrichaceae bacterium]